MIFSWNRENTKLKVAHFSFGDKYGALGAAYELHKMLLEKGTESIFFVRNRTRDDDSIIELGYCDSLQERFMRIIDQLYFSKNRVSPGTAPVSFDCIGISWNKEVEAILQECDVFHIHWVAGFLSIDDIYHLSCMGKPIVWTMHDFHPFTGGCHCPEECRKYETDCSQCHELREKYMDITKHILLEKQRKYSQNIHIVAASLWLKDIVSRSRVFCRNDCEVIPIGIDVGCFISKNKLEMKQKLGFSVKTKIILIGAQSLNQNIKGYACLKQVLKIVKEDDFCKELIDSGSLVLAAFGDKGDLDLGENGIPVVDLGFISDRGKLCEIYNMADVFVFPSIQDTFGMTAAEAMTCGTPVVAFQISAMQDVIISGVNGYTAEKNDYVSMASFIAQILKYNAIDAAACRKHMVDNYSLECEAENMCKFYQKLAGQKNEYMNIKVDTTRLQEFIHQCSYEILTGTAPGLCFNMGMQEILLEYNPIFVSPERKVRDLIKRQKISSRKGVYIYGAGEIGKRTIIELKRWDVPIEGIWDMDENKAGYTLEGCMIQKPINKEHLKVGKIIVAGNYFMNMIQCLIRLGYIYGQDFY